MQAQVSAIRLPRVLHEDEFRRVPADWDDYLDLLERADRKAPTLTIQFLNHEILMSQATDLHEELVISIALLLKLALRPQRQYRVLGSSVKIVIPDHEGDFNADVSVVNGPSDYGTTAKGVPTKMRIKNPEIVVEVLSKSTRNFDKGEKLDAYKRVPTLQHILLVEQGKPFVSVYSRTATPGQWLNQDYSSMDETVRLGDLELPMREIYDQ
jgi:Uma2 family endonuclease